MLIIIEESQELYCMHSSTMSDQQIFDRQGKRLVDSLL